MQESDAHLLCTWTWLLVDEADALAFSLHEGFSYSVFHSESYMVNALATLFQPFCHSTFWACWLK